MGNLFSSDGSSNILDSLNPLSFITDIFDLISEITNALRIIVENLLPTLHLCLVYCIELLKGGMDLFFVLWYIAPCVFLLWYTTRIANFIDAQTS
jgi:hypothetical protein